MSVNDTVGTREAANLIGCTQKYVNAMARDGRLEASKNGKCWVINRASVDRYLDEVDRKKPAPELEDPVAMARLYRELGTFRAVARELGCCKATVRQALRKHNIPITNRREAARPKYVPRMPSTDRWHELVPIYNEYSVSPPALDEMCPRNCPGWSDCLNRDGCIMAKPTIPGTTLGD